jgi:uncharacterized membrane protein YagU involved in acid resistance
LVKSIIKQTIWTGTIASLVMMLPGLLFKYFGLRVGHYGPKLGALLFGEVGPLVLFVQHIIIGWLSALPLIILLAKTNCHRIPILAGAIYGVIHYLVLSSLLLPIFFGDQTPWELGFSYIYPSLVVHIVYGVTIGFTYRRFIKP